MTLLKVRVCFPKSDMLFFLINTTVVVTRFPVLQCLCSPVREVSSPVRHRAEHKREIGSATPFGALPDHVGRVLT